jgi:hypothetical protein
MNGHLIHSVVVEGVMLFPLPDFISDFQCHFSQPGEIFTAFQVVHYRFGIEDHLEIFGA